MRTVSRIVALPLSILLAASPVLSAGEGLPIAGTFTGVEGALPEGWKMNPSFPGDVRIVGNAPEGGSVVELAVGEADKRVGILSASRLPAREGEYVYRFRAKGNGEILLGLSLWNGEEWLRMTGNSEPVGDDAWREYRITVRVPERASKAGNTNEISSVTDIQPALFAISGTVQIANLELIPPSEK